MPYLKENEIVINGKTAHSNSSASDVDDAEESFFENKVNTGKTKMTDKFVFIHIVWIMNIIEIFNYCKWL